ncbi:hypothetical protein Hanom_Chr09g00857351 [Helianthus anomalus]
MCRLKVSRFWDYLTRFGGGVEPNGGEYYAQSAQLGRVHSPSRLRINKVVSFFQTKIFILTISLIEAVVSCSDPWNMKV